MALKSPHLKSLERYSVDETAGTVIFFCCLTKCGGIADVIKGITTSFNLAVMLNQRFFIEPTRVDRDYGGLLGGMLEPNRVDWQVSKEMVDRVCVEENVHVVSPTSELVYMGMIRQRRSMLNARVGQGSVNCLTINVLMDPRTMVRDASLAAEEYDEEIGLRVERMSVFDAMLDMQDSSDFGVIPNIIFQTFHHLFRPSAALLSLVASAKERLGFQNFEGIVAIHLRSSRDLADDASGRNVMSEGFSDLAIDCAMRIERHNQRSGQTIGWLVISDRPIEFSAGQLARHGDKLMVQYLVSPGRSARQPEEVPGHSEKSINRDLVEVNHLAVRDLFLLGDEKVFAVGWTSGGYGRLAAAIAAKPIFSCGTPDAAGRPAGQEQTGTSEIQLDGENGADVFRRGVRHGEL